MRQLAIAVVCGAALGWPSAAAAKPRASPLTPQAIEEAAPGAAAAHRLDAATIKAAILLDRAGFSPGVIDGRGGDNFKKALAAYQSANGLDRSGRLDQATWSKLADAAHDPVLTAYEVSDADAEGPFLQRPPHRLEDMAKLPRLGYASAAEELAERFHMSDDLLRRLNPGTDLAKAGSRIVVANVTPMRLRSGETTAGGGDAKAETKAEAKAETKTGSQATRQAPSQTAGATAAKVEVDKRERAVRVLDASGALIAFFPASIGSAEKPAPSGTFKVTRVSYNPTYHYDPKFHFKEVKTQRAFTVKPGPNNPVGLVWIDLSAPSYGIHGAPNPAAISKTQSHGCVRLTNWDALALATMVRRGTPVDFVD